MQLGLKKVFIHLHSKKLLKVPNQITQYNTCRKCYQVHNLTLTLMTVLFLVIKR